MSKRGSIDEIQKAISDFTDGLDELQKKQFDEVMGMLKDLSLDSSGNIKPTIANLKIIMKVRAKMESITHIPVFQDKIVDLKAAIERVSAIQTSYYSSTFKDFTKPGAVGQLESITFDNITEQLAGAGINQKVVGLSADIVEQHVRDGGSWATMVNELRTSMIGNKEVEPRLISYAKQVINDTLSDFSRSYHKIITSDLGLEWFEYLGALVDSSRPFCVALTAKLYVHESELASIAAGIINGVPVSRAGLMPGTNGENLVNRCGGYNCSHQLIPVPTVTVPESVRKKIEEK